MGSSRSHIVSIDAGGRIVIVHRDGREFTEEDRLFVANSITSALRGRNLDVTNAERAAARNGGEPRTEGVTQQGIRFEIDPFILELEERRSRVPGLTKKQMADELGWYSIKITDYTRGASRPHLQEVRDMGAVPGINVTPMLIPTALVSVVNKLKKEHDRRAAEAADAE